jgi:glucose-6-phosphate 1-epimerase
VKAPEMGPASTITPGNGDLPRLELVAPDGARAEVYLHGAHIVSWVPANNHERLFLSQASRFRSGEPIRGGIPVVFPQFGTLGPLSLHGFARLTPWEFLGAELAGERASAKFRLQDTAESLSIWPHPFRTELILMIGNNQMHITLHVSNTGTEPFTFTAALHTYFKVSDVKSTFVEGLDNQHYRDSLDSGIEKLELSTQVGFAGEVNRIYWDAPSELQLVESNISMVVRKAGFRDIVIWNPGAEKCASVPDLEKNDYQHFVCIEAATIREPVCLAPGEHWEGTQVLEA